MKRTTIPAVGIRSASVIKRLSAAYGVTAPPEGLDADKRSPFGCLLAVLGGSWLRLGESKKAVPLLATQLGVVLILPIEQEEAA